MGDAGLSCKSFGRKWCPGTASRPRPQILEQSQQVAIRVGDHALQPSMLAVASAIPAFCRWNQQRDPCGLQATQLVRDVLDADLQKDAKSEGRHGRSAEISARCVGQLELLEQEPNAIEGQVRELLFRAFEPDFEA